MVPNPLILIVLMMAFFPASIAYLIGGPKRRIVNPFFAVLGGNVALMLITIILAIAGVKFVWLSWVLLGIAVLFVPQSVSMYRKARAIMLEKERETTERRARG